MLDRGTYGQKGLFVPHDWRRGTIRHSRGGLATEWPHYLGCSEVDRDELWRQLAFFPFLFSPGSVGWGHSHSRCVFPSSTELFWKHPHTHAPRGVSWVILKPVKLTIKMSTEAIPLSAVSHGHSWVVRFGGGLFCFETRSHYVVALAVQNSLCNPGCLELTV